MNERRKRAKFPSSSRRGMPSVTAFRYATTEYTEHMKSLTQIPPGTQIRIGRAARRRRVLERAICSVFEGWSYEEIIPPIFDYYDVFAKGWGSGQEEHIYRFIDREGNILALRPE